MRVVLVARQANKRVILWGTVFKTTAVVTALAVILTTGAYLLLAGRWNPAAPLSGLLGGLGISVVLLLVNLLTPWRRLPHLPRPRSSLLPTSSSPTPANGRGGEI